MKLFAFAGQGFRQILILACSAFLYASCASYHERYGVDVSKPTADTVASVRPKHTFFLVGDAGNSDQEQAKFGLDLLKQRLEQTHTTATLLFLGDNIYPAGMPPENKRERALANEKLDNQISLAKSFKGKTVFIPGNHDWYYGLAGLKREADYVTEKLGKKSFLPKKGCAIDDIEIGDDVALILIDSQWFITDWDLHPNINDDCLIKSREDFLTELESLINKNQTKITIIALHHPLVSNGIHGAGNHVSH